jgi:tRNA-splicing ligase RtcB
MINQVITKARVPVKIWATDPESQAIDQLLNVASLPFIHSHVAAMPDMHYGLGATIGSVIASKGAIIPAAVGVDIGCGMLAVRTSLTAGQLPDDLKAIRHQIERDVPVGRDEHKEGSLARLIPHHIIQSHQALMARHGDLKQREEAKVWKQLGTLGGGNHFIELCLDENQNVWIMLHSGSRNIGKVIAEYFISKAKETMETFMIHLPDKDLAYLPDGTQDFADYVTAVGWAQDYAMHNRQMMLKLIIKGLNHSLLPFTLEEEAINCHHNYIAREHHFGENVLVTRKGAIRARLGDLGIIPGSMGTKSYIVRGKGEAQSFHSCSHGAGRRMSRSKAREQFTNEDVATQTAGVECRKDGGVIDELPLAYKDIDVVMANQIDLVEVVHTLKQILCVKG